MDATCNSRRNVTGKFYTGKETWDTVATNINLTGGSFFTGEENLWHPWLTENRKIYIPHLYSTPSYEVILSEFRKDI